MTRRSPGRLYVLLQGQCKLGAPDSDTTRRARREAGGTLVEFALSATILTTLVFGVMAMCAALYIYHFVSDAAREGARYAIVRGSSCSTYGKFTSDCPLSTTASPSPVQTYVRSLPFPGINPNNLTVSAAWSAYPTTKTCTAPCNSPGDLVTVRATYSYSLSIPFVLTKTLSMSSTSEMVIAD
jgi:Flp pilus assembly protein TadG